MHSRLEVQLQWEQPARLQLLEEIRLLERRLRLMTGDGDCAYERAISTLYHGIMPERWRQLARLAPSAAEGCQAPRRQRPTQIRRQPSRASVSNPRNV